MNNSDPIYDLEGIPKPEIDPEFWEFIQNPNFKRVANLLLINEARRYDPATLSNESCRSQLAKLSACAAMIDLPQTLLQKPITVEEE